MKIKIKKIGQSFLAFAICFALVIASSGSAFAASEGDCTQPHSPPEGYVYYSTYRGNTQMEMGILSGGGSLVTGVLGFVIPGLGVVSLILAVPGLIDLWNPGGYLQGDYVCYRYYDKWSSGFWDHYLFYTETQDGKIIYLGCETDRYWISNEQPDGDNYL